ncbi:MAG: low specificity L-threonine aldolase [Alphaproteobacteria bacterium]|nr:low specificity L-threonine aldolase [Alphaproteobacteria bacterium]
MTFLASDNTAGVSAEIWQRLQQASRGSAKAYGQDAVTESLTRAFQELFQKQDLAVFPVFNGSAANSSALSCLVRPYEAIIAHPWSHVMQDECGMPEFFTGAKVLTATGEKGKIKPEAVHALCRLAEANRTHHSRPRALTLTQSTEVGTVYTPQEIEALSKVCRTWGLFLHIDGARFANAVASLGCDPGDISWRVGVDALSFGGTKNGAMLAEAVIFFNPALAQDFEYIRKRQGQLASKQRFISAQLACLLEDDLWLRNAAHANAAAQRLAFGLAGVPEAKLLYPTEANAVFVQMAKALATHLTQCGHFFYQWPLLGPDVYRFVTSFETTAEDIDAFLHDCHMHSEKRAS